MNEKDIFDIIMDWRIFRFFNPFYKKNKEILLYIFFGGLTFIVSVFSFWFSGAVLGLNELWANILSWIAAVLFAYITNRKWVFNSSASTVLEYINEIFRFFSGRLLTLGIEELLIFIFITKLGYNRMLIKIIAQVIVIVSNYVISKLIVFNKKDK